jgi:alpha-N-arabinofuranosidase
MLDLEKNSDVVRMCSYAPLFENVNKQDWPVNLIRFDSSRVIGRSSYYVQKLFSTNRPDVVLKTDVQSVKVPLLSTQVQQVYALAGLDQQKRELVIKVVNPLPTNTTANIALQGLQNIGTTMHAITLANADVKAENTLENPSAVFPAESDHPVSGTRFSYEFPGNSLTVLRIAAQ